MDNRPARLLALTLFAILPFAIPAAAQTEAPMGTGGKTGTGNPAATPPATPQSGPGMPAPHQLNQADRTFLHEAAIGGMGEVDLAKLAEQKAQSDGVKRFAQRMIQDHTKANDRLAALAKAASAPLPSILDEDHRAMRAALAKTSGAAFDRAYLQGQIADHQKTAQLLEYEIGSGQDMQLKSYAAEILPTVLDHLQTAQALFAEAGNVPPQAAAPATPATQSGSTAPSRN